MLNNFFTFVANEKKVSDGKTGGLVDAIIASPCVTN